MSQQDNYLNNPLIHADRRLSQSDASWVRSFNCENARPLIICRGPIRKEAMDVFTEMGIEHFGILLSEKDSIVYRHALAPELRSLTTPDRIHRVPDYSGATREERLERIQQIINIAKANNYDSVFAGYGFMAEDEEMVASLEDAGLNFIGPCSTTVHRAGLKDEAKRTALSVGVSVTPGVDNATALTLIKKYKNLAGLQALTKKHKLKVSKETMADASLSLADKADLVLAASYKKGIDLYSIDELAAQIEHSVSEMYERYPKNRIRLKAISGGGGKGQRILLAPDSYKGKNLAARIRLASTKAPEMVREILNEVKTTGVGDNKNVLVELNIETTRHQEIQVIGNGEWSLSMGARDCSLQMHEQKLLEVSVTKETLEESLADASAHGAGKVELATLQQDIATLAAMEDEAERFGEAVGLDSVSTFECIVDRDKHFFMEMNTRIQVEHRVTELCYGLQFTNPHDKSQSFVVESLVEAMVLLAYHKKKLPKPSRVRRLNASVEARLNATNQALAPHAGGVIYSWTNPVEGEVRDDQGICVHNPDTNVFMKYTLAGAYDSNIALILTHGKDRLDSYQRLANILGQTKIRGNDLATNLEFHYGLVHWFIGNNINARPTTGFILPYLTSVGLLKRAAEQLDVNYAFNAIASTYSSSAGLTNAEIKAFAQAVQSKTTLLIRPIQMLLEEPHILAGWMSANKSRFTIRKSAKSMRIVWLHNPINVLADLYSFLNMGFTDNRAAANMIWDHDRDLLESAVSFYAELQNRLEETNFPSLCILLDSDKAPKGFNKSLWAKARAAHTGYQAGVELLELLPYIAGQTGFFDLQVNADLSIDIPERLVDTELQEAMRKVLVPPPVASSDEILAQSGGMFYAREAPGMPSFVQEGDHFEQGDPLYIVEVMKMFNKVYAPFAGTVVKTLMDADGMIIAKGQPLFTIEPDELLEIETDEQKSTRQKMATNDYLATLK